VTRKGTRIVFKIRSSSAAGDDNGAERRERILESVRVIDDDADEAVDDRLRPKLTDELPVIPHDR
jgi:hypothetical protein